MENKEHKEEIRYEREDMAQALEVLKKGGIILYPTDTIWGIGCDATNEEAVKKIYDLKQRSDSKSMLVLVGSEGELQRNVEEVPEAAWMLIETAVNPITISGRWFGRNKDNIRGLQPDTLQPAEASHSIDIGQYIREENSCDIFGNR